MAILLHAGGGLQGPISYGYDRTSKQFPSRPSNLIRESAVTSNSIEVGMLHNVASSKDSFVGNAVRHLFVLFPHCGIFSCPGNEFPLYWLWELYNLSTAYRN